MKKIIVTIIVIGLLLSIEPPVMSIKLKLSNFQTFDDPPSEIWNKTFGGTNRDEGRSAQQTTDGGYIVAGFTWSYGAGGADGWLIKTDENGKMEWNRTFGGTEWDFTYFVQQTSDGGYIVVGCTASYGNGFNLWLIKTDEKGNENWSKIFGGSGNDVGWSVQQTTDGGYIIAGHTNSYGAGHKDIWLIKTNSSGDMEWNKTFGGTEWEEVGVDSVQQTIDGGYIIVGMTESYGAGDWDIWLIKTDAYGDMEWNKTFGGYDTEYGFSVQQTNDGGYILTGYTFSYGLGDVWLIKTDVDGNEEWNNTYARVGGKHYDDGRWVRQTTDGGYIVVGYTVPPEAESGDIWLIKTDANGFMEWNKTFGGTEWDLGWSVEQTTDGGYIITGFTRSYGAGGFDLWLIKVGEDVNEPPNAPAITGPTNGKVGVEYEYNFSAADPNSDDVYYYIDWGDDSFEEWIGPYASGEIITVNHTWSEKGTYTIRAKAKDVFGAESDWGTLTVTMPKNQAQSSSYSSISSSSSSSSSQSQSSGSSSSQPSNTQQSATTSSSQILQSVIKTTNR